MAVEEVLFWEKEDTVIDLGCVGISSKVMVGVPVARSALLSSLVCCLEMTYNQTKNTTNA